MSTPQLDPAATDRRAHWLFVGVLVAAAGTFALTMGTRQTMGLFLGPLNSATGLGLASISLAFAVGQLWWGLTQPFAGALADRLGAGRLLAMGIALVALGTFLTPLMSSTAGLIFSIGVLAAGGAGIAGPAVLMAATMRHLPPARRGLATGIVNAGGSFGQFVMAPIASTLILGLGWSAAMQVMAMLVLLALPAAWVLRGAAPGAVGPTAGAPQSTPLPARQALAQALRHPSYLMLASGFFVCGFHVAFLATHLPGVIELCGLPLQYGAWSLAMLGLFNIIGSIAMGWAVGRWRMKSLLSLVYATRALAVLVFLSAPKTGVVMLVFAAVMGLTFLSTVPPTAGLVAKFFGTGNMAMLFGGVMLTHQIGGFLGAWLGGKVFECPLGRCSPTSGASATLKLHNEDFIVTELPLQLPSGTGEHIWVDVEKNGANTVFVAQQLALAAGVNEWDVGYAGLKDRYAITRQWFSIYLPKGDTPDLTQLQHPEYKVLSQSRHVKKLRPGDLQGNRFRIVLREVTGDREALEANLQAVAAKGVPNYFGAQRFGHDGGNVEQGRAMLAREIRVRNPKKKGIYLSAVRSFIFNEVLALRMQQGLWGQTLPGDVLNEAGQPTGPLWGRGRVSTTDQAQALENSVAERHATLCSGMEFAGLDQERRALVAQPIDMSWEWPQADQLIISFSLAAGSYATAVLGEILHSTEPERQDEDPPLT
ncbi:MAG: tRNA pseudouridine(13) synthase TruD [Ideonella sp. MAG2]|nr:MAG: tRNA pseudouridine(13) synthase TruD [Ideonella sp. MAG2]